MKRLQAWLHDYGIHRFDTGIGITNEVAHGIRQLARRFRWRWLMPQEPFVAFRPGSRIQNVTLSTDERGLLVFDLHDDSIVLNVAAYDSRMVAVDVDTVTVCDSDFTLRPKHKDDVDALMRIQP